uniref:Uncharacterized protein n=1 Tax=Strigamia maritima TaxID=126957 RepID=T1ISV4_STRMM
MDPGDFGELLHQAEQLTADIDSNGELPRVERNLRQILEVGQQMWTRTAQTTSRDSTDVKASILLGSRGFDLPRVSMKLESLSVAKTFEPLEPVRETDIQGFLRNERENAILTVIEEARKKTFEKAEEVHWDSLQNEWEVEKQRILNGLLGSSQDGLELNLEREVTSVAESLIMKTRSVMDNVELAYARQVYIYNEQVVQGGIKPNLAAKFEEVADKLDDKNVCDMWGMVKYMCDVPIKLGKDTLAARISPIMQAAFVTQARKYLEDTYVKYIKATVFGNFQNTSLVGIPGVYQLIHAFLSLRPPSNIHALENVMIDDRFAWPVIYYCIRCGDLPAAVQAAEAAGQSLSDFLPFLIEYANSDKRQLSPGSENRIHIIYKRSVRNNLDPFKRLVFCVIGGCDVNDDHTEVADKVDDYLWLKLCQLRAEDKNDLQQQDCMTLAQLQTKLLEEYGESHFNAFQQPFLYFQVLFLTAQFEAAIEFLARIDRLKSHSVHVALTLYELNLLALPHSVHASLLHKDNADRPPTRRLNFARLIMIYTKKFQATDPREAVQYFYFLRDLKGNKGENLFMACISELVLETREFEMLLGRLEKDGCRTQGLISMFHTDTQKIIEFVAAYSESKGLFEDATQLYDLAQKHDKVLDLMNKLLSQVVTHVNSQHSRRERLQLLAHEIAVRYRSSELSASKDAAGTFYLLLDLITFFNQYHAQKYQDAIDIMQRLRIIPFRQEEVEDRVNMFRLYAEEVRKIFPDILLATMTILYTFSKSAKNPAASPLSISNTHEDKREEYATYLRKQARAIITFAGMIPYRLPGDTNARLVQLEKMADLDAYDFFQTDQSWPEIYTTDEASMSDRINIYTHEILNATTCSGIESAFVAYVVSNVEPVGWKAVWRSTAMTTSLKVGYDFVVEVKDVSQVALKADVQIKNLLSKVAAEDLLEAKDFLNIPLHEAPLCELFTVFDPKNNGEFDKTAFAIDTVRFFYDYIWRPWDDEDDDDYDFVERHLQNRIKLYYDMESGIISFSNSEKIFELLREAKEVHFEMKKLQQEMNADDINSELKDTDVLNCYVLHKRLNDVKKKLQLLESPVLNTLVNQEDFTLKNGVRGQRPDGEKVIHLISKKFSVGNLQSYLRKLPSDAIVEFHQSLNKTISGCYEGDTILVFPGVYSCLGARPCETVIKSAGSGDIFINCEANSLNLCNLKLEFSSNVTCGLMVHRGKTILENCEVSGSQTAVSIISGAEVKISNCRIQDASVSGVELRSGSSLHIRKSVFKSCGIAAIALQVIESVEQANRITAIIEESHIADNARYGLLLATTDNLSLNDDTLKFEVETARVVKRFPQHCLEFKKNIFEKNKSGDIAVVGN